MAEAEATTKPAKAAPEVKTVTMEDGRLVEFTGKKRMLKTSYLDEQGRVCVRMDFVNGTTRIFASQPIPAGVPEQVIKAAGHGYEQKLGDEISGVADLDDAILAIEELIDRLVTGDWNSRKEGDGIAGASVLAKALIEYTGKTRDDVRAFLGTLSNKEKLAMREDAALKPIITRLESEKVKKAANVDTASLLDNLKNGVLQPDVAKQPAAA
jgi:hypothetical protein